MKNDKNKEIPFENYLQIEQFENGKISRIFNIEHPLYKHVEFEQNGELATREIKLMQSQFFIRLQTKSNRSSICIYEILKNSQRNKLLSSDL